MCNNYMLFNDLVGKTLTKVDVVDDEIIFHTTDGIYKMFHSQDCCERVYIEDINGDVEKLTGEVLMAYAACNDDPNASESGTWTFYTIATATGHVSIRWYGTSNGYYSESVSFVKM